MLSIALSACGSTGHPVTAAPPKASCPLTDLAPPAGAVPDRPALAVKVENLPAARPQYGLSSADVVYEEPVEGGITRFIVIYQCRDADRIEPVRSGRIIDPQIVGQYGAHPLFAYAGGIAPAIAAIDSSSLIDVGVLKAANAYTRDPNRPVPHNLMTSTGALYRTGEAQNAPQGAPGPVFSFGPVDPAGTPASGVCVSFPYSDLTWTWSQGSNGWLRSYGNGPATRGEGGQITAADVIVMRVILYPSPYVEDPTGAHENLLKLTGTGSVEVFRNGVMIAGTWKRPSLSDKTQFEDETGHTISLAPGNIWIELVPTTVQVAVTH